MNDKATASNPLKRKQEIVIIDNEPVACLIHKIKVQSKFSQPLHVFEDAREALGFLTEAGATDFLVLLDIDMPTMDGWQFLSEWQKTDAVSAIKVIMLSCSISKVDKERSRTYPEVMDYFEKPLYNQHLELMEKIIASFNTP